MKKIILLLLFTCSTFGQVVIVKHTAYEIHFDTKLKEPIYTHYILTKSMLNGSSMRTVFKPDSLVNIKSQGSAKDYKNGSFDKGHFSPDDDFRYNDKVQNESMLYTNCAPQNKFLNRGTWKSLENYCRKLAEENDVEIFTGCIYDNSKQHDGALLVPTYYWKLLKYNGVVEAYKMPNITPTSNNFSKYKVDATELLNLIK